MDYVDGRVIADCLIDAYPQILVEVNRPCKPADEIVGDCIKLRVPEHFGVYFCFLVKKREKREDIHREQSFVKTTDFFRRFISWHIA